MVVLSPEMQVFVEERHLATLTLVRADGHPHVTPVGFTWDQGSGLVRVITWAGAVKARLLETGPLRASVCQVEGGRWVTLEGSAVVTADLQRCHEGVQRYADRYSAPKDRGNDRRVIEVTVDHVMGRG
ncbi:MAG: pyridoxamine 5'-phosphate oxidase family protein [Acidimicrobiales bacterium]